jgi:hypothetical protein
MAPRTIAAASAAYLLALFHRRPAAPVNNDPGAFGGQRLDTQVGEERPPRRYIAMCREDAPVWPGAGSQPPPDGTVVPLTWRGEVWHWRRSVRVAAIVRACTDADAIPKPQWRERKERYIENLEHVGEDVLLVSACDKLRNARAIVSDLKTHGPDVFARFAGGREGTLWYYDTLTKVFSRRLPGLLAGEFREAVREMQANGLLVPARVQVR